MRDTPQVDALTKKRGGLPELIKLARQLERENAELKADAERLDALDAMARGYGKGWILRDSYNGRGLRLHETSDDNAKPTVREAIDRARAALQPKG